MTYDTLVTLREKTYQYLRDLETPDGINASGKEEVFGCIFGRDSFITILKILHTHHMKKDPQLLALCKKSLLTHISLQGKTINVESGEQPGKFIHEYRVDKYERLINRPRPWYVYPDNILRNYDSIDATPLGLIALYRYWEITHDTAFLLQALPAVEKGLQWIMSHGDSDGDFLIEYTVPSERTYGGLVVQSWADSAASLADQDGNLPLYPIAPVEVQGISWLALHLWAQHFALQPSTEHLAQTLKNFARNMQLQFNKLFLMESNGKKYLAQALDGKKRQITTVTSHPLICLWANYERNGKRYTILDDTLIPDIVERAFEHDLFVPHAGIRTMSTTSPTFNPSEQSYHNGSFWPMLNGLIVEGLTSFGYTKQAKALTEAMLQPIHYFGTPIELYIEKNGSYFPYKSIYGQSSCMNQAWSAAAVYDVLVTLTSSFAS